MSVVTDEYTMRTWMPSDIVAHLPRLYAEGSKPGVVVVELGVRSGNSTAAFLAAVERHGGHVWSVDIDRPRVPWHGHPHWTFVQGDDLAVADQLPDCDVLFVDTSHHYRHTLAELAVYMPKVKPGGVALFHDTELERPEGGMLMDPPFPVRVALDEYCAEHGLTVEYVAGCHGLGVVRLEDADD